MPKLSKKERNNLTKKRESQRDKIKYNLNEIHGYILKMEVLLDLGRDIEPEYHIFEDKYEVLKKNDINNQHELVSIMSKWDELTHNSQWYRRNEMIDDNLPTMLNIINNIRGFDTLERKLREEFPEYQNIDLQEINEYLFMNEDNQYRYVEDHPGYNSAKYVEHRVGKKQSRKTNGKKSKKSKKSKNSKHSKNSKKSKNLRKLMK